MKHRICTLSELPPGTMKSAKVDNIDIFVVRTNSGDVYALKDRCPHKGANLSKGTLGGTVVSDELGEYCVHRHSEIVRCPWHGWEFDATTGEALVDENMRSRRYDVSIDYDVEIQDEVVYVIRRQPQFHRGQQ